MAAWSSFHPCSVSNRDRRHKSGRRAVGDYPIPSREQRARGEDLGGPRGLRRRRTHHDSLQRQQTGLHLYLGHRTGRNGTSDLPEHVPGRIQQPCACRRARCPRELERRTTAGHRVSSDPGHNVAGQPFRFPDDRPGRVPDADRGANPRDSAPERT